MKKILIGTLLLGSLSAYGVENLTWFLDLLKERSEEVILNKKRYNKDNNILYKSCNEGIPTGYHKKRVLHRVYTQSNIQIGVEIQLFKKATEIYKRMFSVTKEEAVLLKDVQKIYKNLENEYQYEYTEEQENKCDIAIKEFLDLSRTLLGSAKKPGYFKLLYLKIMSWFK